MIDGHRTNDNIYDGALIGTEFPLDVDLIQRVEVIRGPNSSQYVASSFLGVINVVTKRGRDLPKVIVAGDVASYGSYHGHASYGNRIEGRRTGWRAFSRVAAGNPPSCGSVWGPGNGPRQPNPGKDARACKDTAPACHWTRVDLVDRGREPNRADGDRGAVPIAHATAGNRPEDRKESAGRRLEMCLWYRGERWLREFGSGNQKSHRIGDASGIAFR